MVCNNINLDNSKSSAAEDVLSTKERNVRIFAKEMLQGRIFLGHFQETRLVESMQAYRDVIAINKSEIGLRNGLEIVRERLKTFYKSDYWIGITDPACTGAPNEYCLWVESNNSELGFYWYKIRSVRFRKKEIIVKVKILRPMTQIDTQIITQDVTDRETDFSFDAILVKLKNSVQEDVIWFFKTVLTAGNIKQAFTFVCVLLAMVITSTFYGIGYLMDFVLKLMHEISVFIQSSTPVMISVIDLVGKAIGGFYLLITMLFKGISSQHSSPPPERSADDRNRIRAIEMPRYRNSDSISPPRRSADHRNRIRAIEMPRYRNSDSISPPRRLADHHNRIRTTEMPRYRNSDSISPPWRLADHRNRIRTTEMPRYRDSDPISPPERSADHRNRIRATEMPRYRNSDPSIIEMCSPNDYNSALRRAMLTRTCGDPFELIRRTNEIYRERNGFRSIHLKRN